MTTIYGSIEHERVETQMRRIFGFDGKLWCVSFHLPLDDISAPLRSPVLSAFSDSFLDDEQSCLIDHLAGLSLHLSDRCR